MDWNNIKDLRPKERGNYLVYFKDHPWADFTEGLLSYIPGKVADAVITSESDGDFYPPEYEYVLHMQDVFLMAVSGDDGQWWFESAVEVSHWIKLPDKPTEFNINIVDAPRSYSGEYIREWAEFHRTRKSQHRKAAESLYDEVWSEKAVQAGFFPINPKHTYYVIAKQSGTKIVCKRAFPAA